jgi:hypothetical protein
MRNIVLFFALLFSGTNLINAQKPFIGQDSVIINNVSYICLKDPHKVW